ncbi:MAG: hypothetical protein COA79_16070 [Planctomycetota bacterium]|nr:MAG: hypothetical protein COA79_16070 [Planctomycetota bacterium]
MNNYNNSILMYLVILSLIFLFFPGYLISKEKPDIKKSPEIENLSKQIVEQSSIKVGLLVHIGSGNGKLTAAFGKSGNFLVQGLEADRKQVDSSRKYIQSVGLYGQVSIDFLTFKKLPYSKDLINLVVADKIPGLLKQGLKLKEVLRILCPKGTFIITNREKANSSGLSENDLKMKLAEAGFEDIEIVNKNGIWAKGTKPRPKTMDDWPQYCHDGGQTRVSGDQIKPLNGVRWISGPSRPFLDKYAHFKSDMYSANGRLICWSKILPFNIKPDDPQAKDPLTLVAVDAYNGFPLWKRVSKGPPRDIVAVEDVIYTILDGYLVALNAKNGKTINSFMKVGNARLLYADGYLLVKGRKILAIETETGKQKWQCPGKTDLVISNNRAYLRSSKSLQCLELNTGKKVWEKDTEDWLKGRVKLKFCKNNILILVCKEKYRKIIHGISAKNGQHLWTHRYSYGKSKSKYIRWSVFYSNNLVWFQKWIIPGKSKFQEWVGLNPQTGDIKKSFVIPKTSVYGCYPEMATEQFFVPGRPINFLDWKTGKNSNFMGARYGCKGGAIIANNLFYTTPHDCGCYNGMIKGFAAFSSETSIGDQGIPKKNQTIFEVGPAMGKSVSKNGSNIKGDWPTFRGNSARNGKVTETPSSAGELLWEQKVDDQKWPSGNLGKCWQDNPLGGDRLTQPVIAEGKIIVSLVESHIVVAMDAKTGKQLWKFTTGGRLDTPPTIYKGQCLVGCHDGWVYAIRISDGVLAWRFRAARSNRKIAAFGQLESAWPIVGGVLIVGETAYCVSGRTTELDSGVICLAFKPSDGKILWQKQFSSIGKASWGPKIKRKPFSGPADLLISDGKTLSLNGITALDLLTGEEKNGKYPLSSTNGSARTFYHFLDREWHKYARNWGVVFPFWSAGLNGYLVLNDKAVFGFRTTKIKPAGKTRPIRAGGELFAIDPKSRKNMLWTIELKDPFQVEALAIGGNLLFAAGPENRFNRTAGGKLLIISTKDGKIQKEIKLKAPPVSEGIAIADGKIYVSTNDGKVLCFGKK